MYPADKMLRFCWLHAISAADYLFIACNDNDFFIYEYNSFSFLLKVWSVKLEQEVEKNKILSEALQKLATEHHLLKQNLSTGRKSPTLSAFTEDEFYDAVSGEWSPVLRILHFLY